MHLYFGARLHLFFLWDCVGHHNSLKRGAVDAWNGRTRENAVREDGVDLDSASIDEPENKHGHCENRNPTGWTSFASVRWHGLVSSVADGAAGVGHVVHQDGHTVFDVAHQDHAVHFVGLFSFFVDEGKVHVQAVGDGRHTAQRAEEGNQVLVP